MSGSYVSWNRSGLSASADASGALRPRVAINDQWVDGPPISILGPEAIVGFDATVIDACTPPAGARNHSPHMLASVTFTDPDFPWRYTRGVVSATGRLAPWILLVVVPEHDPTAVFAVTDPGSDVPGPHGTLTIAAPEIARHLPDAATAWAWAHVEMDDGRAPVRARLLSPRRLTADTAWRACIVPTTAGGIRAGLAGGEPVADDSPGWTVSAASTTDLRLPVYAAWTFSTGAGADFETLCRRLSPATATDVGVREARAVGLEPERQSVVHIAGVLSGPGETLPETPDEVVEALEAASVLQASDGTDRDPIVGPPLWGSRIGGKDARWVEDIAGTPAWRVAAGAGAAAVRRYDQEIVDGIWRAVGKRARAQRLRDRAQAIETITDRWAARLADAPADAKISVGGGLLKRSPSIAAELADADVSTAVLGTALQRRRVKRCRPEEVANTVTNGPKAQRDLLRAMHRPPSPVSAVREPATAGAEAEPPVGPGAGTSRRAGVRISELVPAVAVLSPGTARSRTELPSEAAPISARTVDLSGPSVTALRVGAAHRQRLETRIAEDVDAPVEVQGALVDRIVATTPELLLPGSGRLGHNVVTVTDVRRAAVAAALVGANHELAREIIWREIPLDIDRVAWRAFWSDGIPDLGVPEKRDKIAELLIDDSPPLVVIIRGDLIEQFPNVRVRAIEAAVNRRGRRPKKDGAVVAPDFEGRLDERTAWFGFRSLTSWDAVGDGTRPGWYFVIEECRTGRRFGFEPDELAGDDPDRWDNVSWGDFANADWGLRPHLRPDAPPSTSSALSPAWGESAAAMAVALTRKPFRAFIHASMLLDLDAGP